MVGIPHGEGTSPGAAGVDQMLFGAEDQREAPDAGAPRPPPIAPPPTGEADSHPFVGRRMGWTISSSVDRSAAEPRILSGGAGDDERRLEELPAGWSRNGREME